MENKKVVFCNVAWMKNYCGITPDDKAVNGGKFVEENDGQCMEVNNFLIHNHKCYGYFTHRGDNLDLKRIDVQYVKLDVADDVTVVWVATNPLSGGRYIVGWYNNAKMYRKWQHYIDTMLGDGSDQWYNFEANSDDCHLIPEILRNFEVPSAPTNGKGKGMGQSNIWYADGDWAKNDFIPKVLTYLSKIQPKCQKLFNDFTYDELYAIAEDKLETAKEVYVLLDELEKQDWYHRDWKRCLSLYNLAIELESNVDTYFERAKCFSSIFYLDESIEDYKKALTYDHNNPVCQFYLMDCYFALNKHAPAIFIGEQMIQQYKTDGIITDEQIFGVYDLLIDLYVEDKDFGKALDNVARMKNVKYIEKQDYVKDREKFVTVEMLKQKK